MSYETGLKNRAAGHEPGNPCRSKMVVCDRWGRELRIDCGRCERCAKLKVSVMTGRLMAESLDAACCWLVTLTYKDEPDTFRYRDIQLFLKRIRKQYGDGVRFFAVGELGDLHKRRHWHLILFFPKKEVKPNIKRSELWGPWPHGWAHIREINAGSADPRKWHAQMRYVCLYLFKQVGKRDDVETTRARWSLKPALGWRFLERFAEEQASVERKELPLQFHYSFRGVRVSQDGPLWKFMIIGAQRKHYVRHYLKTYWDRFGEVPNWLELADKVRAVDLWNEREVKALRLENEMKDFEARLGRQQRALGPLVTAKLTAEDAEREAWEAFEASFEDRAQYVRWVNWTMGVRVDKLHREAVYLFGKWVYRDLLPDDVLRAYDCHVGERKPLPCREAEAAAVRHNAILTKYPGSSAWLTGYVEKLRQKGQANGKR